MPKTDAEKIAARKEKIKAYKATYSATHRAEKKAYDAARYASHKEERKAYQADYYKAHKAEKKAYDAAYYATHKAEKKAYDAARRSGKGKGEEVLASLQTASPADSVKKSETASFDFGFFKYAKVFQGVPKDESSVQEKMQISNFLNP